MPSARSDPRRTAPVLDPQHGLAHSFDAGAEPHFDALRLLGRAEGWVAQPSGLDRPALPDFDAFVSQLLEQTGYASPDDLVC